VRIFIIGYMGAGKSTVGKRLARFLGIHFIDLDEAFESKFRYSIPRFFDHFGEVRFREFEKQCLRDIIETEDGTYYTGMTNDLARRMQDHLSNTSRSATYLRVHKPKYVVYTAECKTRGEAMKLENRLKKDYTYKMECVGPRRDIYEVIDSELSYK